MDTAATSSSLSTDDATEGGGSPYWDHLSDGQFWDHVAGLDSTVHVGLKMPGQRRGVDARGQSQIPRGLWNQLTRKAEQTGAVLLATDEIHPLLTMRLTDPSQVSALRSSPFTEFVEPASYALADVQPYSGCDDGKKEDYERENTISPGDVYPYSLTKLNVDKAWKRSAGEGITIGVVDTGISAHQPQFHEQWDDGQSSGRTITRAFSDRNDRLFSPADYHDSCGHGSRILGLIAAPRDGRNAVGFAYRSNVIAVRALPDPFELIGTGSWDEMRFGIRIAAEDSEIINMSFGSLKGNYSVVNMINYYYYDRPDGEGRLFFGAVGTGPIDSETSVFPASLPNVVAVTGINPVTSSYPNYYPCAKCFRGDDVEFSAWDNVATTWTDENELARVGGSSGGSAQISAIAALVWSRYPNWTRDQVLARLRQAAPLSQKRNGSGYGPPDAWRAVGGVTGANIVGPDRVQVGSAVFEAFAASLDSPTPGRYRYYWNRGSTNKTLTQYASCDEVGTTQTISVSITDTSDGTVHYKTKSYTIHDDAGTCSTSGGEDPTFNLCEDKPDLAGCDGPQP